MMENVSDQREHSEFQKQNWNFDENENDVLDSSSSYEVTDDEEEQPPNLPSESTNVVTGEIITKNVLSERKNINVPKINSDTHLQPVPDAYQILWPYPFFNKVQSAVFPQAYGSDFNIVVAAPTGCGKTTVFEMAIMRLFQTNQLDSSGQAIQKQAKIVYIAPVKALCQERVEDWSRRFSSFGLKCAEVTGDHRSTSAGLREIAQADIIITTPEKWDSLTRCWKDNIFLLGCVQLLLIDEVHLLNEDRGGTLEAVVSRMKMVAKAAIVQQQDLPAKRLRMLALSASLPNVEDIGEWLDCDKSNVFNFPKEYRPVPLTVHVLGYKEMKNQFFFDKCLNDRVGEVIDKFSSGRPTLVFCSSKRGTEQLATKLVEEFPDILMNESKIFLAKECKAAESDVLRNSIINGFAFHHAGLTPSDRNLVERLFLSGHIYVLCTTTTLALGVNLPAHLVIIKGTAVWRGPQNGYTETPRSMIMQMIGRAGRPGFDTSGVAVIMTSKKQKSSIEKCSLGQELVESKLTFRLVEALNTEVCQGVITDVSEAIAWIKSTYFYIRIKKNPAHYKFLPNLSTQELEDHLKKTCLLNLKKLCVANILNFGDDGFSVSPLNASHVMSKYMLTMDTMEKMLKLPTDLTTEKLILYLSDCSELWSFLRRSEKKKLNEAFEQIPFRNGFKKVQSPQQKSSVLIQAWIQNLEISDFSLKQEQTQTADNISRILMACEDYFERAGMGKAFLVAVITRRSIELRCWITNLINGILKQFPGIGQATCQKLNKSGLHTFEDIINTSPSQLDLNAGRRAPFGSEIKAAAAFALHQTLVVSAKTVWEHERLMGITLILQQRYPELKTQQIENKMVKKIPHDLEYTLVAFSNIDQSLLLVRRGLKYENQIHIPSELVKQFHCASEKSGCSIYLISSIAGLDRKLCFDLEKNSSSGPIHYSDSAAFVTNVLQDQNEAVLWKKGVTQTANKKARASNDEQDMPKNNTTKRLKGQSQQKALNKDKEMNKIRRYLVAAQPPTQVDRFASISPAAAEEKVIKRSSKQASLSSKTTPDLSARKRAKSIQSKTLKINMDQGNIFANFAYDPEPLKKKCSPKNDPELRNDQFLEYQPKQSSFGTPSSLNFQNDETAALECIQHNPKRQPAKDKPKVADFEISSELRLLRRKANEFNMMTSQVVISDKNKKSDVQDNGTLPYWKCKRQDGIHRLTSLIRSDNSNQSLEKQKVYNPDAKDNDLRNNNNNPSAVHNTWLPLKSEYYSHLPQQQDQNFDDFQSVSEEEPINSTLTPTMSHIPYQHLHTESEYAKARHKEILALPPPAVKQKFNLSDKYFNRFEESSSLAQASLAQDDSAHHLSRKLGTLDYHLPPQRDNIWCSESRKKEFQLDQYSNDISSEDVAGSYAVDSDKRIEENCVLNQQKKVSSMNLSFDDCFF